MHLNGNEVHAEYLQYVGRKIIWIVISIVALLLMILLSVSVGAAGVPVAAVVKTLAGVEVPERYKIIIWSIRMPQVLAAVAAGAGLAVAGTVMQSVLRNPLGSPFTLGISQAAAFGAAFAVMILGSGIMTSSHVGTIKISNFYLTTAMAYLVSLLAAGVIVIISRIRGATPETMVLTGVALGSLFTAGTMFLQFFADDAQLAAMVFWTFGDVARASWSELKIISLITIVTSVYFIVNGLNYNAIDAGDETAKGLGVRVERVRMLGMLIASMVTAVIVSFLGIIGFVGLVCPHMVRRVIGSDHRFLLPASIVMGSLLLLASDTAARVILAPHLLPVSILTAFMGAPVFIYLITRGYRR